MQKRRPLEFSDPYDEGASSSGGSNWSAVQGNRPKRKSLDEEADEFYKRVSVTGKCPSCGSISIDYVVEKTCPECGYQE